MKTLEINQVLELALEAGDYHTVYKFLSYATQAWGDVGVLGIAAPVTPIKRNVLGFNKLGRKPFVRRRGRAPMLKAA